MGSDAPPVTPVATPTVDQSVIDQQTQDLARQRRGRAATILAGDQSSSLSSLGGASLSAKSLLGS